MDKFKSLEKIKDIYAKGENIIQYLKELDNSSSNSVEDILISYDFQAGSYVKRYQQNYDYYQNYCSTLAEVISNLGEFDTLMEIGVGEATTLGTLIKHLKQVPSTIMGLDISWSRIKFAKHFLADLGIDGAKLFTADLFEIPLADNAIDVVYTSHSIEPNGGREKEALKELIRITNKYLILLEPSYEFANEEARKRMESHGYVTRLKAAADEMGLQVIEHRLFDYCANPKNPTGLMIIEKTSNQTANPGFTCPITQTPLRKVNDNLMYSNDSLLAYPIVEDIPCLLRGNSILASHFNTDYNEFKSQHNI